LQESSPYLSTININDSSSPISKDIPLHSTTINENSDNNKIINHNEEKHKFKNEDVENDEEDEEDVEDHDSAIFDDDYIPVVKITTAPPTL
jgi:hypothetical protein